MKQIRITQIMKFKTMFSHQSCAGWFVRSTSATANLRKIGPNLKNKPNVKLGKKDVSSLITNEYERFWVFLSFLAAKNKANLFRHKTIETKPQRLNLLIF